MISSKSRQLLEPFRLHSRYVAPHIGEYLSREAGHSLDFYDYRPYQRGDELRYVDWKVYRRTGKLYTRLYQAERALNVHIVLDTSHSMLIGNKVSYAKILANLLLYVARGNASYIYDLTGQCHRAEHTQKLIKAWRFVENMVDVEDISSYHAITNVVKNLPYRTATGILFIISDFFSEEQLEPMLRTLASRQFDVVFLQTIAETDISPTAGYWQLHDRESNEKLEVNPAQVRAYHKQVLAFLEHLRHGSRKVGIQYHLIKVPTDFGELHAVHNLRKTGLLRS